MKHELRKIIILSLLICVCMGLVVFSDGGEGKKNAFSLESANPMDGQEKVAIDSSIHLTFNKNVVNIVVKENNKNCFSLLDQDGQNVPIDIVMADDQIDREKRNEIVLVPNEPLLSGNQYTVVISKDLMSKNGKSLDKEVRLTFTTVSEKASFSYLIWILGAVIILTVVYLTRKRAR